MNKKAFNLKDLHSNYQYKAFGIPWLGLKRGLADEMVVAPYGSILAITDYPKEVYQNLKRLEEYGMYNKYGFYESIDFTPERLKKGSKSATVKTYMAHHQGLILLSINNLFNNNILQKRFMQNPEINAKTHKAIAVILFKLEGQLIQEYPEYNLNHRLLLDKIDYENGTIELKGKTYKMV